LRLPPVGFRMLDRYVASIYLKVFGLAFVGLLGISYISLLTELAEDLFQSADMMRLLAPYLVFETPQIVYHPIPIATLVATLSTIGLMPKNSEIVVMKACGISLYRAAAPLLLMAAISTGLLFGLEEQLLAESNRRAGEIRQTIRGEPARTVEPRNRTWIM